MSTISIWAMAATIILGQQGSQPTRIAVVNVPQVSEKYIKTSDLEGRFNAIRLDLNTQRDTQHKKIERLQRSLREELKPGTDAFMNRQKELAMAEAELQWFVDSESVKVERGLADALREIYNDIQVAVREVAEDMGIDVVISSDNLPDTAPESSAQMRQQIILQKVVYFNPKLDITNEVVTRLNAKYGALKRQGGVGSANPVDQRDKQARATSKPKPKPKPILKPQLTVNP